MGAKYIKMEGRVWERDYSYPRMALWSTTFQKFQMNQWLGKFWTNRTFFRIAAIGDRESLSDIFLDRILGWTCDRSDIHDHDSDETLDETFIWVGTNQDALFVVNVAGVDVDVNLVPALSDVAGYKDERYIRAIQGRMRDARSYDLVIFCVNMSDTRLRGSVLRTFQELNTDWSRTIIALTFADALPALTRHRNNPDFHKGQHFNSKLAEWTRELKAMLEHIGVQQEVIAKMNMHPCAHEDLLPNGEPWLVPLSLAIMEILSPRKKAAFLKEHATPLPTVATAAKQPAAVKQLAALSRTVATAVARLVKLSVNETTEVQSSSKSDLQMSSASSLISDDQVRNIRAALSKLRKDCPVFGILVIGRTGVGKSTLINNLLGKEVASVGHTLKSETPMVKPHEYSVEGVPIIVYDTPGLGDVRGEEDEAKHLDNMKDLLGKGKIHLVVYCFQMTKSLVLSSHKGALHKYHQIGVDWKRSIIALTFADALYIPKNNPYFTLSDFFDMRVDFWQDEVKKLVEELDVKLDMATQLKVFPTSLLPTDRLPNENSWYVPLWLHIVKILSPAASVRFVDIHRGNICDEQTPPLNQRITVELKLGGDARNQLAHSIVATVEATGMVSNEDIRARLTTALESGVGVYRRLFVDEQAHQSRSEPCQSKEEAMLCFKTFGERFVEEVQSKDNPAFTAKLQRQKVIPERLKNKMAAADDNESANGLLFDHLCQQSTCDSLSKLLATMIEAEGYPVMSSLGTEMKIALGL